MNQPSPSPGSPPATALDAAPLVREVDFALSPFQAARKLAGLPHLLLLESSMRHATLGRYSFLMADPVRWFQPGGQDRQMRTTFDWLDRQVTEYQTRSHADLPPFQGGVAGLLHYEFNRAIEKVPVPANGIYDSPVCLGVYDVVIAWDHQTDKTWLVSQGFPEKDPAARRRLATTRADFFLRELDKPESACHPLAEPPHRQARSFEPAAVPPVGTACPDCPQVTSNFERDDYIRLVRRALEYIGAGDIFQVNLSRQLTHPATAHPLRLYERLRECNASTFGSYFDTGPLQVISASPERLVSVRQQRVETRPIKGTRRRTRHPEVDIHVGQQLLASEKDRSENVMIVDLMRNDLSRICTDDSVRVSQFVELESYASVLHLVSAIEGRLRQGIAPSEILQAVFPGGSITGAPKIRSMEIIAELEQTTRGPYCGSLGYFGFDGNVDQNILIRTITAGDGVWRFPVGGGIVADSDPAAEYEETWTKARGMLAAVTEFAPSLMRAKP